MTPAVKLPRHPAKFSDAVLRAIYPYTQPGQRVLDPFAGTGKVHLLNGDTVGVELEPEWAAYHPNTIVGDALHLPFDDGWFDAIVTSPCYGNRMADSHNAKDVCRVCAGKGNLGDGGDWKVCVCGGTGLSRRNTYKAALGHNPTAGSSCVMQWGPKYRAFHHCAWTESLRVLKLQGLFILNISDHVRNLRVQQVSDWHHQWFLSHGCVEYARKIEVRTPRNRQGENGQSRVACEWVFIMRKVHNAAE